MRRCPPGTMRYVVRPDDTLYKLAQKFETSIPAIVSANPFINPRFLMIGQELCIPSQPIFPSCPEGNYYRIKERDTLYSIAQTYNISLDDLIEANPRITPTRLRIGQIICIPLAVPPITCPPDSTSYIIKEGDTFFSLSKIFNVTVEEIQEANPSINPRGLLIGQKICIPNR